MDGQLRYLIVIGRQVEQRRQAEAERLARAAITRPTPTRSVRSAIRVALRLPVGT